MGLGCAVEFPGNRRSRLAFQDRRTRAQELLADADHLLLRKADRLGDLSIPPTPFGMVFIRHHQHTRPAHLRRRNRLPTTNHIQLTPLPSRQSDLELLRRVRHPCFLVPVIGVQSHARKVPGPDI